MVSPVDDSIAVEEDKEGFFHDFIISERGMVLQIYSKKGEPKDLVISWFLIVYIVLDYQAIVYFLFASFTP